MSPKKSYKNEIEYIHESNNYMLILSFFDSLDIMKIFYLWLEFTKSFKSCKLDE